MIDVIFPEAEKPELEVALGDVPPPLEIELSTGDTVLLLTTQGHLWADVSCV